MHRIDTATADADANGSGKAGFTEGDPSTATPPTALSAAFFNAVQEEIAGVVEGAGVEIAKGNNGQLLAAVRALIVGTIAAANWVLRTAAGGISANLEGVASDGASALVVVGASGTIQSSGDGGATWTARTAAGSYSNSFKEVVYGAGLYVATGDSGEIQTSPDGVTWTKRTGGGTGAFGLAYGAGLFVSTWSSGVIYTSPDGITWTARTGVSSTAAGAGYGDGLYLTVGGTGQIQTSPDGITWTARTAAGGYVDTFWSHAYGHNLHVIVGNAGEIQTSPDGITWTRQTSGISTNLRSVVFSGGIFVACGEDSNAVLVSWDGVTWEKVLTPAPAAGDLNAIAFDGQGFVAVGSSAAIVTSLRAVGA